jgi:hypothetical protein
MDGWEPPPKVRSSTVRPKYSSRGLGAGNLCFQQRSSESLQNVFVSADANIREFQSLKICIIASKCIHKGYKALGRDSMASETESQVLSGHILSEVMQPKKKNNKVLIVTFCNNY